MEKTASMSSPRPRPAKAKLRPEKSRKNASGSKAAPALDPAKAPGMIDQIRREVEIHHDRASEVRARLEELAGTALSELLKVKELKGAILSLKEDGVDGRAGQPGEAEGAGASAGSERGEQWPQELDKELEKLLIIQKLLEASAPAAADNNEPQPEPSRSVGRAKRVLIIDDDPTTVKLISHFLEKESYQVSTSLSGVEGLKKAFREAPDMILLDIMMPDLNGFQFLSIYRKAEENTRTPVLILSSLAEEADILKGLEIGAVDYITKPFSPQLLMAKIRKNLSPEP